MGINDLYFSKEFIHSALFYFLIYCWADRCDDVFSWVLSGFKLELEFSKEAHTNLHWADFLPFYNNQCDHIDDEFPCMIGKGVLLSMFDITIFQDFLYNIFMNWGIILLFGSRYNFVTYYRCAHQSVIELIFIIDAIIDQ